MGFIFHLRLLVFGPSEDLETFERVGRAADSPYWNPMPALAGLQNDLKDGALVFGNFLAEPGPMSASLSKRAEGYLAYEIQDEGFPGTALHSIAGAFPKLEFWATFRSTAGAGWLLACGTKYAQCGLGETNMAEDEFNELAPQCFLPGVALDEVEALTRQATLQTAEPQVFLERARALARLGRHQEAVDDLTTALESPVVMDDDLVSVIFERRGDSYRAMGEQEEAVEDYRVAAEIYFSLDRFERWEDLQRKAGDL